MTGEREPAAIIERLLGASPPRAGSLAITIFGDTISQHGNTVWLGSLVRAMEQFGLNTRQIRTAIFRLGKEGWLSSEQAGRRSYCSLSESGRRRYARAAERIYAVDARPWDGTWTLVMPAALDAGSREALRRELGWQGFGQLSSGVLAHPRADADALAEALGMLGVAERVVIWRAESGDTGPLPELIRDCWQLDALAARFESFIREFGGLLSAVAERSSLDPRDAFRARTLLIHEYRRLLLRTNDLPAALLPASWPGHSAMRLAAGLYRAVHLPAMEFARATLHNRHGALPAPEPGYFERFGGLEAAARAA